jgi:hypothetical protein
VILAAGLLVLLGLGLFVAGVLTGVTALYWACVGACAVAAVLLVASRRQMRARSADPAAPAKAVEQPGTTTASRTGEPAARPAGKPVADKHTAQDTAQDSAAGSGTESTAEDAPTGVHATAHRAPVGATADGAAPGTPAGAVEEMEEPPVEEVEVTDLLLVVDLTDEVLVVDEHPRYHLDGCRFLTGRETIPLPLDEARTDGFTPCALCAPDRHLADRERARKAAKDR